MRNFLDDDSKAFLPRFETCSDRGEYRIPVALLVSSRYVGADAFLTADLVDQSIELGPLSNRRFSAWQKFIWAVLRH